MNIHHIPNVYETNEIICFVARLRHNYFYVHLPHLTQTLLTLPADVNMEQLFCRFIDIYCPRVVAVTGASTTIL